MALRSLKQSSHTVFWLTNHDAMYLDLQPQMARMCYNGVGDDAEDLILESSISMHVQLSGSLVLLEQFRNISQLSLNLQLIVRMLLYLRCNKHDLTDLV